MKYSEYYNKKKFGTGFYIAIAVCLLIIGGASWFALAPLSETQTKSESKTQSTPSKQQEYTNPTPSYTESTPEILPELNPTSDVIQSTEETESDTQEVTVKEEKVISFTMPVQGEIIKKHSNTELQYSKTFEDMRLHTGMDIACKEGTSVSSCAAGTVIAIENDSSLGNTVAIDHGDGIIVKYSSIDNLKVENGSKVNTGTIIGTAATIPNECADDSHIHIEVTKNGDPVDPLKTFGLE